MKMFSRNAPNLPRSFWKELDTLDKAIYEVADPAGVEAFGSSILNVFHAMWQSTDSPTNDVYWRGRRFPRSNVRPYSQLVIASYTPVDGTRTQALTETYQYRTFPFLRELAVRHEVILDVASFEDTGLQDPRLSGVSAVATPDQCDRLIIELERGASGEYSLPTPT